MNNRRRKPRSRTRRRGSVDGADSALFVLEEQFDAVSLELLALQRTLVLGHVGCAAERSHEQGAVRPCVHGAGYDEAVTRAAEAILARLDPIERAIMKTPAHSIAGLGVKARHAAHVMSQYWS